MAAPAHAAPTHEGPTSGGVSQTIAAAVHESAPDKCSRAGFMLLLLSDLDGHQLALIELFE
jgi:hypothetical protein